MQSGEGNFDNLGAYIRSEPGLLGLVERCFKDIDPKLRTETIVKSLGWYGFRNRLAAVFLEYQLSGRFPLTPNLDLCHELIELEDKVKLHTVEGFSRAFLLGFYWKLHRYKEKNEFVETFPWEDLLNVMGKSKARVVKIDWLLLTMAHMYCYMGKEVLREALKGSPDYKDLYNKMDDAQKKQFMMNSLSYGASIHEPEFFYQSRI